MMTNAINPLFGMPDMPSELRSWQRHALSALVVAIHGGLAWAVIHWSTQVPPPMEPATLSVELIAPTPVVTQQPPAPTPEVVKPTPQPPQPAPAVVRPSKTTPLLTSNQPASPKDMVAPPAQQDVKPAPVAAPAPAPVAAPPAPAAPAEPPRAPAQPKVLPSSAVGYLVEPVLTYPRASRELGEQGVVRVRVLVDEQGRPTEIRVEKSSGFARLDQAAVNAMRSARFKPHFEDGVARPVWAIAPMTFNLED